LNVLLVHAHPEPRSFVAAMRDTVADAWRERGAEVVISDLYAENFNPVASAVDFGSRANADHLTYALEQRHGLETGTLAPDIRREVDRVLAADVIGFTFPLFWFSVPAILKGWIDRVFLSGPFYGGRRIYGRGGLVGRRAFAAFALGGRSHMFGPEGLHGELETGMMRHFFRGTLGYVGLSVHTPFVAYHVPYVDDAARKVMLAELRDYVLMLDARETFPLPDLSHFDDRFRPIRPDRDAE
jgi:NAD(P)H dehydrogenase (quinone)